MPNALSSAHPSFAQAPLTRLTPPKMATVPVQPASQSNAKEPMTAILSALPQEQAGLLGLLQEPHKLTHAGRDFWCGRLHGQSVVLALSRIGKVAAATTATALIERFSVGRIVFTGVAGGLKAAVNVGDVVVADSFVQHDMDASPLYPRYEMPLYDRAVFRADDRLAHVLRVAAETAFATSATGPESLAFAGARVHWGLIASGDRFMGEATGSKALQDALLLAGHDALAVEMEGAAVAQVCHDYGVPFAAVRTISDRADDSAHIDFQQFVNQVAGRYACSILSNFLLLL